MRQGCAGPRYVLVITMASSTGALQRHGALQCRIQEIYPLCACSAGAYAWANAFAIALPMPMLEPMPMFDAYPNFFMRTRYLTKQSDNPKLVSLTHKLAANTRNKAKQVARQLG